MARILAVDDARVMRDLVKAVLESAGHQVLLAEDGVEALEKIRTTDPVDVVITDINMPNMSGISLVTKLRRLPEYRFTPILMLTTESSDYKKNKSKTMGASGWIQKPVTEDRLIRAVNKVLDVR